MPFEDDRPLGVVLRVDLKELFLRAHAAAQARESERASERARERARARGDQGHERVVRGAVGARALRAPVRLHESYGSGDQSEERADASGSRI